MGLREGASESRRGIAKRSGGTDLVIEHRISRVADVSALAIGPRYSFKGSMLLIEDAPSFSNDVTDARLAGAHRQGRRESSGVMELNFLSGSERSSPSDPCTHLCFLALGFQDIRKLQGLLSKIRH